MSGIGIYSPATYSTQKSIGRGIKMSTHSMKEKTMRRTLKQRIRDWLNNDRDDTIELVRTNDVNLSRDNSLRFEIHQASGGRVVQTRRYDEKKDRHFENLYIITTDQDFGREIDKIITMEALR
jgi:hypothetical protein